MELHRNDRVRMPAKPEWGLGRVLQEPAAGKVSVHFREAGEKVLSLKHAQMESVEGDAARDAWLDNVDLDSKNTPHYLGPREALSGFLEKYPGGLRDPRFLVRGAPAAREPRALCCSSCSTATPCTGSCRRRSMPRSATARCA